MFLRLATEKARVASQELEAGEAPVLAADTAVVIAGRILGKPEDEAGAVEMLSLLSGETHEVFTGVAVVSGQRTEALFSRTEVRFRDISPAEIRNYWQSGEPADKAGAYAIQGQGAVLIEEISGSYTGVWGCRCSRPLRYWAGSATDFSDDMRQEILINATAREVRVAVMDNGVVQELLIERASRRGLVGNIYTARFPACCPVCRPHSWISGYPERRSCMPLIFTGPIRRNLMTLREAQEFRDLLREGQQLPVQVMKDPIGTKGARLTTHFTIPSRYLVLLPKGGKIGISARIEDEGERVRLKDLMEQAIPPDSQFGYIVRTVAEGVTLDALRADMLFLHKLWDVVVSDSRQTSSERLNYEELSLAVRVVRDMINADIERVQVDSREEYARLRKFTETFMPDLAPAIEMYTGRRPILDLYGVEDEIEKALNRKVALKSGGCVIFDQTEAMTTIDVNTGGYVGHRNLEETIFRTNLEAAVTIARQLRLRNLGGIIIIDFIDMGEESHRRQVLEALENALADDHVKTQISEHSALGLVEMTRKRTRESLEHIMCDTCPTCDGNRFVKTPESICYEIFREILRQHRQFKFKELVVLAHQDVVELLLDEEAGGLAELEELTGAPIRLQTENMFVQDRFDVVLM